jgi:hypothetical protein
MVFVTLEASKPVNTNDMLKKHLPLLILCLTGSLLSCQSQTSTTNNNFKAVKATPPPGMATAAYEFIKGLSDKQRENALFDFDDEERYNWHFIPKTRKGIALKELDAAQLKAAMNLLRTAMSDNGYAKTKAIIELEGVLREVEGRPVGDDYRDSGKYYFSVFGNPAADSIWGWRLEGHHVSLNFSSQNNKLISGTPGFMGSNPAVVLSGPEKGKHILKDETELGLTFLQSLDAKQKEKAVISNVAPGDIVTANRRKAMINDPKGILYTELNASQKKSFIQLLSLYIQRYNHAFAMDMMQEIEEAGLDNLRFAWAGEQQTAPGHPHYYRIQGPTLIIEYDNTQNNANHIHTVIRDLKHDFGGDQLLEHYKNHPHKH